MNRPIVEAAGLVKHYRTATRALTVLRGVDLCLNEGQFLAIMGASGSGKSTLLNILGCLDRPSAGTYRLDGLDVLGASDDQLSHLRSRYVGFIFQTFNLLSHLTVSENVALPFLYQAVAPSDVRRRVQMAVQQVGLAHRVLHRPNELSGGEMQRVAVARALAIEPKLILADEPTGNLDSRTSGELMQLFQSLHRQGRTLVVVTHDPEVAAYADTCITLHDGQIVGESS
jgi:putative ABC transport system ATP-binding protein